MHTIHDSARPVRPRDSRKGAQPAYTAAGERIVKRHAGPTAHPLGTTVIESHTGARLRRTSLAGWQVLDKRGEPFGALYSTDDLLYPLVEIRPKQAGHHLDRAERRRDDRAARKAEVKLARFKSKRVEQYLAAVKAAEAAQ